MLSPFAGPMLCDARAMGRETGTNSVNSTCVRKANSQHTAMTLQRRMLSIHGAAIVGVSCQARDSTDGSVIRGEPVLSLDSLRCVQTDAMHRCAWYGVSIYELVTQPREWHGRRVRVIGYAHYSRRGEFGVRDPAQRVLSALERSDQRETECHARYGAAARSGDRHECGLLARPPAGLGSLACAPVEGGGADRAPEAVVPRQMMNSRKV